ncbi:MAG TPA: biotin/lipoyl-containing protein [Bacillota bacterium]|nr:biotin/lipoyl-containing protein [Bacillota bacterium]
MQIFRVTVNGKAFEVTVDDVAQTKNIESSGTQAAATAEKVVAEAPAPVPVAATPATVGADEKPVTAPLSGTILSIKAKPGETVKYGQVLLTLEALKMENEIVAPADGVVKAFFVQEGNSVNLGDVLLTMG